MLERIVQGGVQDVEVIKVKIFTNNRLVFYSVSSLKN